MKALCKDSRLREAGPSSTQKAPRGEEGGRMRRFGISGFQDFERKFGERLFFQDSEEREVFHEVVFSRGFRHGAFCTPGSGQTHHVYRYTYTHTV
jgi:hypothetical protein